VRILVVSNLYPPISVGGYELACAGIVEYLSERHEVVVLTSDHESSLAPVDPQIQRSLPYIFGFRGDAIHAPARALSAARVTRKLLADVRPDLVFVWNGTLIPQVSLRILETSGLPLVYCIMEHWFSAQYQRDQFMKWLPPAHATGSRRIWGAAIRAVNRYPTLRVDREHPVPSAVIWNAEIMRALSPPPHTVRVALERVIPLGSPRDEQFERLVREPSELPTLLFSGRVVPEKGPDLLIRAAARLRERWPVRVEIVGPCSPDYAEELRAVARQTGLGSEAVIITGPVTADVLGEHLRRASALVIPSRWQEPAPLMAVEAAFARTPLAASRSGGIPSQFAEEHEALFFDIEDVEELSTSLERILADPVEANERAARAYSRAQEYRFSAYGKKIEAFLGEATAAIQHSAH
jgi:glycogen(starch) synthase